MRQVDEQAFVDFVTVSSRSLRRTAFLLTGDWHRAEDAVQAALVKLYIAWPRLVRSEGMHTYAKRALVSVVIDESRRPWRREHASETTYELEPTADGSVGVENRMVVMGALARLPPRQRAAVVLRYYDDLSVEQAADVLSCTTGTVKSQTARGLDALRAQLVAAGIHQPVTVGEDA